MPFASALFIHTLTTFAVMSINEMSFDNKSKPYDHLITILIYIESFFFCCAALYSTLRNRRCNVGCEGCALNASMPILFDFLTLCWQNDEGMRKTVVTMS